LCSFIPHLFLFRYSLCSLSLLSFFSSVAPFVCRFIVARCARRYGMWNSCILL
jgi:hypothetical protein